MPGINQEIEKFFNPDFFSHGRILHRFSGSDACRFSPKLAWRLLSEVEKEKEFCLWDPFCGSGLIPCMAYYFFNEKFSQIIASDLLEVAVKCTQKNLTLFSSKRSAIEHTKYLISLGKRNVKSEKRWGLVHDYFTTLIPFIPPSPKPKLKCFSSDALAISENPSQSIYFISDFPYGISSKATINFPDLIASLREKFPNSQGSFILKKEQALGLDPQNLQNIKQGRVLYRFKQTHL